MQKKKKKSWISNALVQACFFIYLFFAFFLKSHLVTLDSGSCPCDTRKCLTPIVARQKVVLIPLWEGREGSGEGRGRRWRRGCGCVGWVGWVVGCFFCFFCEGNELVSRLLSLSHRRPAVEYAAAGIMTTESWGSEHGGYKRWGDAHEPVHTETEGDVFSLLTGTSCREVTCCLCGHFSCDALRNGRFIVQRWAAAAAG